jgi:hypothetical protein
MRLLMLRSLAALHGFTLKSFAGLADGEGVGNLHDHLAIAVRAKALLTGVFVFDFKDVSVGTFNLNSHGRPTSRTTDEREKNARNAKRSAQGESTPCLLLHDPY